MSREMLQTLSEQMYYILMALMEERCGVDIMKAVEELSKGRIKVGPGTSYTLLDKFLKLKLIEETKVEGRKRSYIITDKGKDVLQQEYERLKIQLEDGFSLLGGEK
jgi:DNA-binding PadR family transcriptional regulator